jgi:hypothetical protein
MKRRRIAAGTATAAALASLALVAVPGGVAAETKESYALKGEVYPTAFKIEMKTRAGRKLVSVKAGNYRIKIEDPSAIHNFRLKGPGVVNKATSVAGKDGADLDGHAQEGHLHIRLRPTRHHHAWHLPRHLTPVGALLARRYIVSASRLY